MEEEVYNHGHHEVTSFLNQSMENIPLFRARHKNAVTDEQRIDLTMNFLNEFKKEVDAKAISTEAKSKWLRLINALFSLLIIASSGIIIGLQAASECVNIPVIVLSSIIFVVESINKLFRLGAMGVLQKHGTIQLKRLSRQAQTYIYSFYKYTSDQLLTLIEQLRTQFDDIDATLYSSSMGGTVQYNNGELDIEHGGSGFSVPHSLDVSRPGNINDDSKNDSTPHVHIHIDRDSSAASPYSPYLPSHTQPEKTTPVLVLPSNQGMFNFPKSQKSQKPKPKTRLSLPREIIPLSTITPSTLPRLHNSVPRMHGNYPNTPLTAYTPVKNPGQLPTLEPTTPLVPHTPVRLPLMPIPDKNNRSSMPVIDIPSDEDSY